MEATRTVARMPWTVADPQAAEYLKGLGDPPDQPDALFSDANWTWAWQLWAGELAQTGDVVPYNAGSCLTALLGGSSLADVYPTYVEDGAPNAVPLPMGIRIRARTAIEGGGEDPDVVRESLRSEMDNTTYGYLGQFHTAVGEAQAAATEAADYQASEDAVNESGMTRDHIALDYVDQVNEGEQKNLEEGQSIDYIQSGNIVLLGDRHHNLYYDVIKMQDDYAEGTLTMVEKGAGLSPGEISVTGTNNEAAFKEAVRRYSKKKIDFQ